jgi:hypothetical protein
MQGYSLNVLLFKTSRALELHRVGICPAATRLFLYCLYEQSWSQQPQLLCTSTEHSLYSHTPHRLAWVVVLLPHSVTFLERSWGSVSFVNNFSREFHSCIMFIGSRVQMYVQETATPNEICCFLQSLQAAARISHWITPWPLHSTYLTIDYSFILWYAPL